jgi:hypothetical protein
MHRGTKGSNPVPSSGESGTNSVSWIMVGADRLGSQRGRAATRLGSYRGNGLLPAEYDRGPVTGERGVPQKP